MKVTKSVGVVTIACLLSVVASGADGTKISARDVFGIAVDEPLGECIRPSDTNGIVLVQDWKGGYCFGRAFCGIQPSKFEIGEPDEKGRRFVRLVEGGTLITNRVELTNRCAKLSSVIKGYSNMKREESFNVNRDGVKSAAWTGVGQDGIPFAISLAAERPYPDTNIWYLAFRVMDYGRFAAMHGGNGISDLREANREERLDRCAKKRAGRHARMMKEKAYSGRWACKAKGYDCIAFCFDKSGLGFFEMVIDGFMHSESVAGGWFYWTADEKGEITVHAPRQKEGPKVFKLKYDYERNMMIPDMKDYPFAERVIPKPENPGCEMQFVNDMTPVDMLAGRGRKREFAFSEWDAMLGKGKTRDVASLSELCAFVEDSCAKSGGFVLRRDGCPTVIVESSHGEQMTVTVSVVYEIRRDGDCNAPKFECLAGMEGPDIVGKKECEPYFDLVELERLVESLGGRAKKHSMAEEGFWTAERWNALSVEFKGDNCVKCKEFLKFVVDGKYEFPVKAIVGM